LGGIDNLVSRCVDLRTGAFDVPPQEILTKDSVTVSVDAVVYYQVNEVNVRNNI
jgi:erythrocyte band 7 integral membrane protein